MTPQEFIGCYGVKFLYHFTDSANLDLIRERGALLSLERLESEGITPPRPGGNEWSRDADRLNQVHRFVHLSFFPKHPMCHVAEQEGRIGPVTWLKIDPMVLSRPDARFTLDVANKSGVELLDFENAVANLDLGVMFSYTNWTDPAIQERRQTAEKAEILIPDLIKIESILNT